MQIIRVLLLFLVGFTFYYQPTQAAQTIEAEGIGLPVSANESLNVKKQEAFVAAVLDGLKNLAEIKYWQQIQTTVLKQNIDTLNWKQDVILVVTHERIGGFKVESRSIMKGPKDIIENIVDCHYQNQKLVVKNRKLIFPGIHFTQFPSWQDFPPQLAGIQIREVEWRWDRVLQEWWCVVKVAYTFDS